MSEIHPLNKLADIEKWINNTELKVEDIDNLINDETKEVRSHILKRLLTNYFSNKNTTTTTIYPLRIIGPVSISYLKSTKYNKYIIFLGDIHKPVNFKIFEEKVPNSMIIDNWISSILSKNTKLIDIFVESGKYYEKFNDNLSINKFQNALFDCFNDKNCSARIHWVDVRRNIPELNTIANFLRGYYKNKSVERLDDVKNIVKNLNLEEILKYSRVYKQFENVREDIYKKYMNKNEKFFERKYVDDILLNLVEDIEKAIIPILNMLNFLMNFYTIGRMFKSFTCKSTEYCPEPTFIICYFGKNHTDDIKKFLKEELQFEETFNIDNTANLPIDEETGKPIIEPTPVINIEDLPQPLFSDVNL